MKTALAVLVVLLFSCPPLHSQPAPAPDPGSSNSLFEVRINAGAIVSLKPAQRGNATEFIAQGRRLGDAVLRYRQDDRDWQSVDTAMVADAATYSSGTNETGHTAVYHVTNDQSATLVLQTDFKIQPSAILWTLTVQNVTSRPLEIGDLSVPLPISRGGRQRGTNAPSSDVTPVILKHSFLSGHGSFLFWMRSDSAPPFLTLVSVGETHLEYWENQGGFGGGGRGFSAFIHSAAAGAEAKERGTNWRQPHTSLTLAPKGQRGDSRSYTFKFRWANSYDDVRQILVDEGGIDTHVVPGMTVPTDLAAQFALRTRETIHSVEAEFPKTTKIQSLGTNGDYRLYQVQFSRLGENRLTIRYGEERHMFLEFFSAEPIETLIKKRGAFLARSQQRDPAKWYNGLITDWNLETQKLLSPDDYAPIPRNRYYAVTCDDPGLGKPAFLAAKNAEFPVQSEVEALDYYIKHFVWGGLQQTTNESYPYAIYGIPDWKTNRSSADPGRNGQRHLWRVYDYPHIIQMYFAMYRVAKGQPQIKTELAAQDYLRRAYGTARAMFTVPFEIERWSAYGTGFYNELVIVDLIAGLEATGLIEEANTLRGFWERKVKSFVNREQDLFRSEYAFDSTGFESTHALARYAMLHADASGETNFGITPDSAHRFLEKQMAANLFCRGTIEPAYYLLGSDYRGGGGNAYTLTYMSQMGGWSVLDYALNFATNPAPFLRLGYASYLSAWALMNTGTPESNYGYWFPGKANDGGAGGGFEPAPFGRTWLGQPHHRGSWNFACEIDLGYCGALRTAATILADDSIFGRYCFGGDWRKTASGVEVIPKDGLRRRFIALLGEKKLCLLLERDRFAMARPVKVAADFGQLDFMLESDNPNSHDTELQVNGLAPGDYTISSDNGRVGGFSSRAEQGMALKLPMAAGSNRFTITRKNAVAPVR